MRPVTHETIKNLHQDIARAHRDINGFFRMNLSEIQGQFRKGIQTPTLVFFSHSADIETQTKISHFNNRDIVFWLLDFTGKADNYTRQDEVLDELEEIALDILTFLNKCHRDKDHWLFGKFEASSYGYTKIGPVFDNMYGWEIVYQIKNHEDLKYHPEKWDWSDESE
jgi:hypothetical protein